MRVVPYSYPSNTYAALALLCTVLAKKTFAENKPHRANHVLYTELTCIGRLDLGRDMTYDGINEMWMTYTYIWS